ncbi:MAG: iron ABC transporter permease [Chloroflexi bacterium]|nr:iron ABC transporter permease [Chloroflexota bacterium]
MAFFLSFAVGAIPIPLDAILNIFVEQFTQVSTSSAGTEAYSTILLQIRLPHTILILITGAALGGSGAAYQGLFRNPLADPYLIGAASGAGLGAIIAMAIQWPSSLFGFYTVPVGAFIGAFLAIAIVYMLAYNKGSGSTSMLLLAGVAVGSFATALTSYLMLRSEGDLRRTIAWLLGGSTLSGWDPVLAAIPYIALGLGFLVYFSHALNVLQFGEQQAQQLGLPVTRVKSAVIIGASLATAAAISFSGIIGFVGLIIPHTVRFLWGPDHRNLIPLSIIGGASILLSADLIARRLLAPQTLPVGVITALIGAPFFLWILRRVKDQGGA